MTRQEEIEESLSEELKRNGLNVTKDETPDLWLAALEGLRDGWEEARPNIKDEERFEYMMYMLTIHGMIATQKLLNSIDRYFQSGRP